MEDRISEWKFFSTQVEQYITDFTISKYGRTGVDLMDLTPPTVAVWNIFKYCWRLWNGKGKKGDLFKIAHYAQMAFSKLEKEKLSEKDLVGML